MTCRARNDAGKHVASGVATIRRCAAMKRQRGPPVTRLMVKADIGI